MSTTTPKDKIEAIIATHGYKWVKVVKCKNIYTKKLTGLYKVISINDLPQIIMEYVNNNYNMVFCSANRIEFYEHIPIGVETYHNDWM